MTTFRTLASIAVFAALTIQPGCKVQENSGGPVAEKVDLDLETTRSTVSVGDTATITARSKDTYGRRADVEWMTTGGKLTTEENGRLARVKFDKPGTYTVTGILKIDGKEVKRDTVNIEVRPTT